MALRLPLLASSPSRGRPARSFVGALGQALEADPDLVALLGGVEVPKVWYRLAPNTYRESRLLAPYLVFTIARDSRVRPSAGHYLTRGEVEVSAYAPLRSEAGQIADRARLGLVDAMEAGTIAWTEATLLDLFHTDATSVELPGHGRAERRLWRESRSLGFVYEES